MAGEIEIGMIFAIVLMVGVLLDKMVIDIYGRTKLMNTFLKKNLGIAEIFRQNRKVKVIQIDLSKPDFDFEGGTHKTTGVTYVKDSVPVLIVREDDAVPRDILADKVMETPSTLQSQKRNIFNLVISQFFTDESKRMKYILIAAIAAALLGLINLFFGLNAADSSALCVRTILAVNGSIHG